MIFCSSAMSVVALNAAASRAASMRPLRTSAGRPLHAALLAARMNASPMWPVRLSCFCTS